MDFSPILLADPAIQIHAVAAVLALVLGTAMLLRRKGDRLHRAMGRVWIGLMAVVALSSFLITEIRIWGAYSWIHILSVATLVSVTVAVFAIRAGNVRLHAINMVATYVSGLLIAGGFTLLPGRRMHALLFADSGVWATGIAAGAALAIGGTLLWRHRRPSWRSGRRQTQ